MQTALPDRTASRLQDWLTYGALAFAVATALSAVGVFVGERKQDQIDAFPILVVYLAILTGLVFALAVRPAIERGSSPRRVAVLGGLALVGIPVFWAGFPAVLGLAALALWRHAPSSPVTLLGVVLATVALVANVVGAFIG